jgi:large subunit ribosomal protein L2
MGRRPIVRRRGSSPNFMAPTHRRVAPAAYNVKFDTELEKARLVDLVHDPGRGAPLALIETASGKSFYTVAAEGSYVGQEILIGRNAPPTVGNILPLGSIPEGTMVLNVERKVGDGGALFRASGNFAVVISHNPDGTVTLKDTKGRLFVVDQRCLANVGVVAGGGRTEKPFLKAGNKLKLMKSRGRLYPIVRGVAMIAAYHPHGGGRHMHVGGSTSVSRNAPPGAKVGLIAPRKTGRKKMKEEKGKTFT